jgi:protein disulfide-isomerase
MKKLFTQVLTVCAVLALGASAAFAAEGWGDNYTKAAAQAKAENKLLLLDFTGSDWCGWCIKLNKEVFSQPEFKEYAAKNLVLMEVDFPQTKQLPANVKSQNARLQSQYKIEGYPTIIVLNGQGKKVGELGYQEGGPKAFIAALDKLKK